MKPSQELGKLARDTPSTEHWAKFTAARYVALAIEELTDEVRTLTNPTAVQCQHQHPRSTEPHETTYFLCPNRAVRDDARDDVTLRVCQECYDDRRT